MESGERATRTIRRLVFVYAANSGPLAVIGDTFRKLLMLRGCALCSITHGLFGERREWTECRNRLGIPVLAVHRDEVRGELARVVGGRLPCILAETAEGLELLLGPESIERCRGGVEDLMGRLEVRAAMAGLVLPESAGVRRYVSAVLGGATDALQ